MLIGALIGLFIWASIVNFKINESRQQALRYGGPPIRPDYLSLLVTAVMYVLIGTLLGALVQAW